jgi:arabinofuranosyltransferase
LSPLPILYFCPNRLPGRGLPRKNRWGRWSEFCYLCTMVTQPTQPKPTRSFRFRQAIEQQQSSLPRKLPLLALLVTSLAAVTYYYWLNYHRPPYGIDDANIYFVYMRNLAEGHGFVWTVGGERVEGFTSILWTLIGAACYLLSPARFPLLLLALNFVMATYTVFRVMRFVRRLNNTEHLLIAPTDILILAMLFFPLGFIEWSLLTLLETGLWLFLLVNATLNLCDRYLDNKRVNLFTFSLMVMALVGTRPEGLLFGPLLILLYFTQTALEEGLRPALRRSLAPALLFAGTAAALIAWRLSYFGFPFPNTYYAKVSSDIVDNVKEGIRYFFKFCYAYPHLALAIGLLVAVVSQLTIRAFRQRRYSALSPHEKIQALLFVVIAAGLALPVVTGGDHFKYSRFYQFFVPLLLISLFNLPAYSQHLASLQLRNSRAAWLVTAALLPCLFFLPKSNWIDFGLEYRVSGNKVTEDFDIAMRGRFMADYMNRTFADQHPRPSAGVIAAGGFAYNYLGETVDLMGLNNVRMAHANREKTGFRNHASFDIATFWTLRPDIVGPFYGAEPIADTSIFHLPENTVAFRTSNRFLYDAYKGIFDQPQFIQTYLPALIKLKSEKLFLFAYYHRSFLDKLNPAVHDIILLPRRPLPTGMAEKPW